MEPETQKIGFAMLKGKELSSITTRGRKKRKRNPVAGMIGIYILHKPD